MPELLSGPPELSTLSEGNEVGFTGIYRIKNKGSGITAKFREEFHSYSAVFASVYSWSVDVINFYRSFILGMEM